MKGTRTGRRVPLLGLIICAPLAGAMAAHAGLLTDIPALRRAYIDTTYLAAGQPAADRKRLAAEGKTEFSLGYKKVQINMAVDFAVAGASNDLGLSAGDRSRAIVERVYMRVPVTDGVAFQAGSFIDPLGLEQEDAPDRDQVSHGQIYNLLDGQTTQPGNNVQGVAFHAALGHSSFFAALLNDLGGVSNRRSLAVMMATQPAAHLRLQGGFATQAHLDANPASAETLMDLSAVWTAAHYTAAVEYLAGDKLINSSYSVTGDYHWSKFLAALRWDDVSYQINGVHSTTTLTVTGAYRPAPGFKLAVEFQRNTNPNTIPLILALPAPGSDVRLQVLYVF